jgi:hypothetical protein
MKKLLSLLMLVAFLSTATFAQTPAPRTSAAPAKTQASKAGIGMKKDGTPDKRYKMNKAEKPVTAGPVKKDGSLDKRYKANKTAAPKK